MQLPFSGYLIRLHADHLLLKDDFDKARAIPSLTWQCIKIFMR